MRIKDVAVMILFLVVMLLCCTACGPKITIQGGSTHTVQGEATVKVVIGVDTTVCEGLEPAAKLECIQALLDLAKAVGEARNEDESTFPGMI